MVSLSQINPSQVGAVSTRSRFAGEKGLRERAVLSRVEPQVESGGINQRVEDAYAEMDAEKKRLDQDIAAELADLGSQIAGVKSSGPSIRELVPAAPGAPRRVFQEKPEADEKEKMVGGGEDSNPDAATQGPAMSMSATGVVSGMDVATQIGLTMASVVGLVSPLAVVKGWVSMTQKADKAIQAHRGTISSMSDPGAKGKRGMHDAVAGFGLSGPGTAGPTAGVGTNPGTQGGGAAAGFGSASTPGNIGGGGHSAGGGGGGGGGK